MAEETPITTYSATAKAVWLKEPLDEGAPGPEHFLIRETPVAVSADRPLPEGAILLRVAAMSADPYLRGSIKTKNMLSGKRQHDTDGDFEPTAMTGFVAGKVLLSNSDRWQAGDLLGAALPFQSVQIVAAEALAGTISWKLTGLVEEDNLTLGVGALGMPGATAYGGLIDVLRPEEGQTLFVSSASGAVGSLVGQIAKKVKGCKVVGSCGGAAKVERVTDVYGFDAAIDYKALEGADEDARREDLTAKLRAATGGEGIDMYFENVGGIHFDAAMATLRPHGRIAVCGCIHGYNEAVGPKNSIYIGQMIYSSQRIEGFVCMPWLSGKRGNFLDDMSEWIREGKVIPDETFFDGIEQWPVAFSSLFTNTHRKRGKVVVRVSHDDETMG